ncbi:hypothetical protein [Bacillus sp. OK048]|uniref:hypothetical protein n=1 Tax=Bacillus sp. OK048 TaxID=1882761 RepID=UPI00088AF7C6|nr:hypothetical protein [Bacillus sp. OK048]SDM36318.1 hypothetical protein SAMN05443253_10362 [Bacillus sp. OK048]
MIETLHILNGQAMYDYYKKTHYLEREITIPFNEAMCFGNISGDLFSQEFVENRAKVHHVTPEQYTVNTLKPLEPLINGDFSDIVLWFDADMFCQINVLTILAWLDKIGHINPVILFTVGDEFELIGWDILKPAGFEELYKQVIIHKNIPHSFDPYPLKKGIERYLHYLKEDSELINYIQEHQNIPEEELVTALINHFTEYGLGDVQYLEIIKAVRGK